MKQSIQRNPSFGTVRTYTAADVNLIQTDTENTEDQVDFESYVYNTLHD